MSARSFRHTDDGTSEALWLTAPQWDAVPALDLEALAQDIDTVMLASAHPDDETLAAGGLLHALSQRGLSIRVLVASDGEASHPHASAMTAYDLGQVRRRELEAALATLEVDADIHYLGLPDSGLSAHVDRMAAELVALASPTTLLLAPWSADGHSDHDSLGVAAQQAATQVGAPLLHYPLWLWHWAQPLELPWGQTVAIPLDPDTLELKRHAVREHRSQCEPLGLGPGDQPVVGAPVIARASRPFETFLWPTADSARWSRPRPAPDASAFDAMYDGADDPWGFTASPYEAWKRTLVLAMLRRPHYDSALEIGCANGQTSAALAPRVQRLISMDVSRAALDRARTRNLDNVEFIHAAAPHQLPEGRFDLILVSEVLYFLHPLDVFSTLRRCQERLNDGGELVLVNWQHPSRGIPLDGSIVHEMARQVLGTPLHGSYIDRDVRIDIWGGAASLAHEEGRV